MSIKANIEKLLKHTELNIADNVFICNELSDNILVNYLKRKHPELIKVTGEKILTNIFNSALTNKKSKQILSAKIDKWTIISEKLLYDEKLDMNIYPLILSTNRILEIIKLDKNNRYIIDALVANYINNNTLNICIVVIDKLFTNYKDMPTEQINIIDISKLYSRKDIYEKIQIRLKELDTCLKSNTIPKECKDIKWHKKFGKSINMTCKYYCDIKDACKYNKTNSFLSKNKNIKKLIF